MNKLQVINQDNESNLFNYCLFLDAISFDRCYL